MFKDQSTPVDTFTEKTYITAPSGMSGWKITTTYPNDTKSEQLYDQGRLVSTTTFDVAGATVTKTENMSMTLMDVSGK